MSLMSFLDSGTNSGPADRREALLLDNGVGTATRLPKSLLFPLFTGYHGLWIKSQ